MRALLDRHTRSGPILRFLLAVVVALAALVVGAAAASAQVVGSLEPEAVHVPLEAQWWVYLVSVAIPLIVALFTKWHASSVLKSSLAIILSAVTAWVQQVIDNDGVFTMEALRTTILALVVQLLAYHQLWKPVFKNTGVPLPDVGIGGPTPPPHPEP